MPQTKGARSALALAAVGVMTCAATTACVPGSGDSSDEKSLTILNFSGDPGAMIEKAAEGFEKEYGVTITWTEGSGSSNYAKVVAGKGRQQYDVVFTGDTQVVLGEDEGVLEKVDTNVVDTGKVLPELLYSDYSIPIGLNETAMFYNEDVFAKNGWGAPTDWSDLLDPKYCGKVGLSDVSVTYGAHTVVGLGGLTKADAAAGDIQPAFDRGLDLVDADQNCIDNFETDAATLSQKMQSGQAVIGTNGSTRIIPMIEDGVPLKLVQPASGAIANISSAAVIEGAPNSDLAQKFLEYMLRESTQKLFVEEGKFGPATDEIELSPEDSEVGVPSAADMDSIVVIDSKTLAELLPDWTNTFHETVG